MSANFGKWNWILWVPILFLLLAMASHILNIHQTISFPKKFINIEERINLLELKIGTQNIYCKGSDNLDKLQTKV